MEYMNEKVKMEGAAVENLENQGDTLKASQVLENETVIAPVAKENPAVVEEKKLGWFGKIKEGFAKKKEQNFLADNEAKLNVWFNSKGIARPSEAEMAQILADAKADGYEGRFGTTADNKLRYQPTKEISYKGGANSSGGPTAGA